MRSGNSFTTWVPVLGAISLLLLGVLIGELGFTLMIQSSILLICIVILGGISGAAATFSLFKRYVVQDIEQLRQAVVSLSTSRSITDEFMALHEAKCKCKEIWIVSPDLHKDVDLPGERFCFKEIVYNNITERHVKYVYIISDNPTNRQRAKAILAQYSEKDTIRIEFYLVPADIWVRLPYVDGDFIIYNPIMEDGIAIEGYYELPVEGRDQWVKIEDNSIHSWVGRVSEVLSQLAGASCRT